MASFLGRQSNPTTTCAAPASRCNSYQPQSENETAWIIDRLNLRRLGLSSIVAWYPYLGNHRSAFSLLLGPRLRTWKGPSHVPRPPRKPVPACVVLCAGLLLLASPPARAQEAWDAVSPQGEQDRSRPYLHRKGQREGPRAVPGSVESGWWHGRRLNDTVTMKMMYGTIETPEERCFGSTPER